MSNTKRFENETWAHEAETCEGCVYFHANGPDNEDWCSKFGHSADKAGRCDDPDAFKPNLLCRQVRAAEESVGWQERMEDLLHTLSLRPLARLVNTALDVYMRRIP